MCMSHFRRLACDHECLQLVSNWHASRPGPLYVVTATRHAPRLNFSLDPGCHHLNLDVWLLSTRTGWTKRTYVVPYMSAAGDQPGIGFGRNWTSSGENRKRQTSLLERCGPPLNAESDARLQKRNRSYPEARSRLKCRVRAAWASGLMEAHHTAHVMFMHGDAWFFMRRIFLPLFRAFIAHGVALAFGAALFSCVCTVTLYFLCVGYFSLFSCIPARVPWGHLRFF